MIDKKNIMTKKVNRKEFLQYALVAVATVAAVSPMTYLLGSNTQKKDSSLAYGNMPYGGKIK